MGSKENLYWIWLAEALGAGNQDVRNLLAFSSSPYELFRMSAEEIDRIPDIGKRTRRGLSEKSLARAVDIVARCEQSGIEILTYCDSRYPYALQEIKAPPVLLYYKGVLPDFGKCLSIGLVGTRSMSEYGMKCAYRISYGLARAGAVTVSGMAAGIDGVCAAASMRSGGVTVAVLGCGPDIVYPRQHGTLMREIEKRGAVMSEYPPGTAPAGYRFPIRNRIISGLSQATVVVEAGSKSGSLITAREAVTQGRVLFAVPVSIRTGTEGTNRLLGEGARVVATADDILNFFSFAYPDVCKTSQIKPKTREIDYAFLAEMGVIDREASASPKAVSAERSAPIADVAPKRPVNVPAEVSADDAKTSFDGNDVSEAALVSLDPIQREVLRAMPDGRAVSADALSGLELPYSDILAALTMLEILGAVQKLPGALYQKI